MNSSRPKLAVLISGGGTTLQNLIDRIAEGRLDADIGLVVSSHPEAFGITRARRANLPVQIVEPGLHFSTRVFETIRSCQPDWVLLAGWLKLLKIPNDYTHRVLNIHPSLLPSFGGRGMYGLHVHEAVLQAGVKLTGCTVHFADNSYDTGPILVQKAVPVRDHDTPETLAARVFAAECDAYPEAIEKVSRGGWRVVGRRVIGLGDGS